MLTGPSLQWKGPGKVSLPLQAPSRKPSLLSKLTLAPAIRWYNCLLLSLHRRQDTKPVISSTNAETLAVRSPSKGNALVVIHRANPSAELRLESGKRRQKTMSTLLDQMTISGRFVVNAISVGNMKLCFKSVATCQSVQPSNNDGLRIFLRASFEIFPSLTN